MAARHTESRLCGVRIMAQQVVCGERDDVFACTPQLALLALTSSRDRYNGRIDVAATIGLDQGILLSELYGTSKASKLWDKVTSESLASRSWSKSRMSPGTLFHASHVTTIKLDGNQKGRSLKHTTC